MGLKMLNSCCGCYSLKIGTIISGVLGILLAIVTIVVVLTTRIAFKTIILDDFLSPFVVKIILVVNLCMTILLSILLVVGALKRNHYLFLPWIILGIMLCIGLLIDVIYTAIVFFSENHFTTGLVWLIIGLICVFVYFYMWAVVFSHFQEIKDSNERGRYSSQPYRR